MQIANDIIIRAEPALIPAEFAQGTCALALTSPPFAMMLPGTNCWALLADWLPVDAPVGMFVTFWDRQPADGSARVLEVHSIGAVDDMRGSPDENGDTVPVVLGRWLFDQGYLTRHSPDRTDRGDEWAQKVGGELPDRDQKGTVDAAERSGLAALDRLNQEIWAPAPGPPLPT
jgi:hypothetical protein